MDRKSTRARLATVPDGDYTFADYLDDDGAGAPVRLTVTLRVRGEEIELDMRGAILRFTPPTICRHSALDIRFLRKR